MKKKIKKRKPALRKSVKKAAFKTFQKDKKWSDIRNFQASTWTYPNLYLDMSEFISENIAIGLAVAYESENELLKRIMQINA